MKERGSAIRRATKVAAVSLCLAWGILLSAAGLTDEASAQSKEKISLRLSWLKEVADHCPFYLAVEKGYYTEEGLDLTIFAGKGSPATVKVIGGSPAGVFGYAGYESMVPAIHQGVPIKGIFAVHQQSPLAVMSMADKPVKTANDLLGKKFAVSPQSNMEIMFYAVMAAHNIPKERVELVHAPFNMGNSLLLQGKVDGVLQWFTTLVPILEAKSQGKKIAYLPYSDLGINVHANGLNANLKTIETMPDVTRKFLRATARGYQLTREDREAAVAALVKHNPKARGSEAVIRKQLDLSLHLWYSKRTKDMPIGWIHEQDWNDALGVLKKVNWIDKELPHDRYYTNQFNPGTKWKW